jgi:hypothetical protein
LAAPTKRWRGSSSFNGPWDKAAAGDTESAWDGGTQWPAPFRPRQLYGSPAPDAIPEPRSCWTRGGNRHGRRRMGQLDPMPRAHPAREAVPRAPAKKNSNRRDILLTWPRPWTTMFPADSRPPDKELETCGTTRPAPRCNSRHDSSRD